MSRAASDARLRRLLGYELWRAAGAFQADARAALRPLGLRPLTFHALTVIDETPGLRQAALAATLGIEGSNVGAVVEDLVAAGWVERTRPPGDMRSYALAPTEAGRETLARATRAVEAREARMLQGLGGDDRAALRRALRLIEGRGAR